MIAHTGFLVTARRLASGVTAPARRRRPAKGAHPETAPAVPVDGPQDNLDAGPFPEAGALQPDDAGPSTA